MCYTEERLAQILPKGDHWLKDEVKAQKLRWVLLVLTWISWIFSVASVADCTLLILVPNPKEIELIQNRGLFNEGYFEEGTLRGCIAYASDSSFQGAFMASRVFGVFLALFMTFSLILVNAMVLFVTRFQLRRMFLVVVRIINPLNFFFSAFLFSLFSSDECKEPGASCRPGAIGIVAAVNSIVIVIISVLAVMVPGPKYTLFIPVWQVPTTPNTATQQQEQPLQK